MNDFIQFRFVPTMRCNLKCSYCFLRYSQGNEPTMFDKRSPDAWIAAMGKYSRYQQVEFYLWGGEPFILDGTYDLINGFSAYDFIQWARVDTNMTFVKKIINRCPSPKVKLLCSWHTETFDYQTFKSLVWQLQSYQMVGMANFVASDSNLAYLKQNNLELDDLIKEFDDHQVFLNVAADFSKGTDPAYKEFITRYTHIEDWKHIHNCYPSLGAVCDAGQTFFSVDHDGVLHSCGIKGKRLFKKQKEFIPVGNFFKGTVNRKQTNCPNTDCVSIVSYAHRLDNDFSSQQHLQNYVVRNRNYRMSQS